MFKFYYLFQPFVENIRGVEAGSQENWFNNNVFYRRPKINGPLARNAGLNAGFTAKFLNLDLLPNGATMVILPSPYTLLALSDVSGYENRKSAIIDLAQLFRAEAEHLVANGVARIQYDEPAIVYKQSLESLDREDLDLLQLAMQHCGRVNGATTSLHTYFGDAAPILEQLLDLPVDCIGIDATETAVKDIIRHKFRGKELALGLIDARTTAREDPKQLARVLELVAESSSPEAIWLTPNTGTEYRGWTHGIATIDLLIAAINRANVIGGVL